MKIEQVTIKNFKCLKDISITLKNITLITGVNSSGKSSFIQTLLLVKQNINNIIDIVAFDSLPKEDLNNIFIEKMNKMIREKSSIILDGHYLDLVEAKEILYQESFDELINIKLNGDDDKYLSLIFDTDSSFNLEHNINMEYKSVINIFDDFYYIRTDRATPSITYPLSDEHIRKGSIGLNGEYTTHYLNENRHKPLHISALKHPNSVTEQLLENVSKWLGEISNGIDISVAVHEQLQLASLSYQYEYDGQTTSNYTPLNVGFGVTYVLPIIVAILKSKPDDLLIIENLESHLHPAGQSKIAELCAIASSKGVQIIIETHSDHFLNGIRVATKKQILKPEESQIYYFEKKENELETIDHDLKIDKEGRIDNWPKGFFDEWDNKLDELLW
jgi:predicted ATPase